MEEDFYQRADRALLFIEGEVTHQQEEENNRWQERLRHRSLATAELMRMLFNVIAEDECRRTHDSYPQVAGVLMGPIWYQITHRATDLMAAYACPNHCHEFPDYDGWEVFSTGDNDTEADRLARIAKLVRRGCTKCLHHTHYDKLEGVA